MCCWWQRRLRCWWQRRRALLLALQIVVARATYFNANLTTSPNASFRHGEVVIERTIAKNDVLFLYRDCRLTVHQTLQLRNFGN